MQGQQGRRSAALFLAIFGWDNARDLFVEAKTCEEVQDFEGGRLEFWAMLKRLLSLSELSEKGFNRRQI